MKSNFATSACMLALVTFMSTSGVFAGQAWAQTANQAAPSVTLRSDVKIERTERDASGNATTKLFTPKDVAVVPGDNIVFTLLVNNATSQPAVGFKATNPMPAAVRFASVSEDWADVSIDGGKTWGKLVDLKVKANDATGTAVVERAATPEDVTHVRWVFTDAIAPGATRTVSYRGVVK